MRRMTIAAFALCGAGCLSPDESMLAFKDLQPPGVLSTKPAPSGTIPAAAALEITFSEEMDPASLSAVRLFLGPSELQRSIALPPPGDVPSNVEQRDLPYTVQVIPSAPLSPHASHALVIGPEVTDHEGNALGTEVRIPFIAVP